MIGFSWSEEFDTRLRRIGNWGNWFGGREFASPGDDVLMGSAVVGLAKVCFFTLERSSRL